ncbi:dihydroorotase family protein [Conexibacter stalactiti]|uniref:Dihydroorotase family protein n=1 Tax=Conexibacter stalactiti TaxID=1940611 RepID=A0ABU4I1G8_9ACTN|nr:dihydroorotase family protein [Conexibacter stalactiti]MDW5598144.1 dihydroorotase family protein [Conexibacter stalactiti]MEC5038786.1 dihydroorotase family protein [Conexibacter stalactiti]
MRLHITGGTLVTGAGAAPADLLCEDGRIAALLEPGQAVAADERLDASGLLVFPGFIDPHVHSRDPGITEKETFANSTAGALAGGLTTIFEMPNAVPPVTDAALFERRAREHGAVASVDFGLWGQALGEENLDDLGGIVEAGAVGIKLFWGYALDRATKRLVYTYADASPDEVIQPPKVGGVYAIVQRVAAAGGLFSAHCEERGVLAAAEATLPHGIVSYADLLTARPAIAEVAAVTAAGEFSLDSGCRFHVVHVSARRTVAAIAALQAAGAKITAEACAHYLVLTDADVERVGPAMKVYPPIRTADDQAALWDGLADGTLGTIASDHAPHAPAEKAKPLAEQPAGIHGVETLVPLVLDAMHRGRLRPEQVARLLSEQTAATFRVDHRKGRVRVGNDADFTLVDPARPWTIEQTKLHTLHPTSIFDGFSGHGAAVASVIRGELAMRDGEPVGAPRGALVRALPEERG